MPAGPGGLEHGHDAGVGEGLEHGLFARDLGTRLPHRAELRWNGLPQGVLAGTGESTLHDPSEQVARHGQDREHDERVLGVADSTFDNAAKAEHGSVQPDDQLDDWAERHGLATGLRA